MENIEAHIAKDKEILDNPMTSPNQRRHIEGELHELEVYAENHKEEIEAGDHHDPTALELFCEVEPSALECKVFDD
ncbi:CP12 protein [Synechococcus phage ACG-2014j]|uniref:Carbon metabolic regulator n=2 Tax=Potamoivirus TaxID=2948872 RepID=A0A1D8KKT5_9CAUD|nr:CP12 protein [Synechococcus phage ACG-2014j]YP_009320444.1 carbon metabolic regulator [Synechococcus phage S-CAM4]AIX23905.1 CP12 protein [Synechococcus phage ACG-2014j]AOV59234.1 carbon metabolic regulator [Synechococcus phage S-CAM4]AOV59472.1 carbon metabolic regulator [Synechococcus phage S-CAM4]